MRCQNIGACCQKCCQKALGQVDKHGRNRRRGLYVKVSFCLHETPLCCYRTDCGHPLWQIFFGNTPVLFWQHTRFILATHPFYFGNTPVLFWQHTLFIVGNTAVLFWQHTRFILATLPIPLHLGNTCQPSCWLLFQWLLVAIIPMLSRWLLFRCFPGGSKKQDSTTKPHVFLKTFFPKKHLGNTLFGF